MEIRTIYRSNQSTRRETKETRPPKPNASLPLPAATPLFPQPGRHPSPGGLGWPGLGPRSTGAEDHKYQRLQDGKATALPRVRNSLHQLSGVPTSGTIRGRLHTMGDRPPNDLPRTAGTNSVTSAQTPRHLNTDGRNRGDRTR